MSAVNMSIGSLEHLVSGYYNKGELKVKGNKIVAVNSDVHSTGKNNVKLSKVDNEAVRRAVYQCFERTYGSIEGMSDHLAEARKLLLGKGGVGDRANDIMGVAGEPLSRDEVRALVKALFRLKKAVTKKYWWFASPSKLETSGNAWFDRAELIGMVKRGEIGIDKNGKLEKPSPGKMMFIPKRIGAFTTLTQGNGCTVDSNLFRGWNSKASIQSLLTKNTPTDEVEVKRENGKYSSLTGFRDLLIGWWKEKSMKSFGEDPSDKGLEARLKAENNLSPEEKNNILAILAKLKPSRQSSSGAMLGTWSDVEANHVLKLQSDNGNAINRQDNGMQGTYYDYYIAVIRGVMDVW